VLALAISIESGDESIQLSIANMRLGNIYNHYKFKAETLLRVKKMIKILMKRLIFFMNFYLGVRGCKRLLGHIFIICRILNFHLFTDSQLNVVFVPYKTLSPWAQGYKILYVRNLQMFLKSYSVCPGEAFPA
jgi:hypothetical protein